MQKCLILFNNLFKEHYLLTNLLLLDFSTNGHWCQCRRKLYSVQNSSIVIQPSCENSTAARRPKGQAHLQRGSSAPPWSALLHASPLCAVLICFAVLWHLWCFSSERQMQPSVCGGKKKCAPRVRGDLTYMDRTSCPWLVCPANKYYISLQFNCPKSTVLIGQNTATVAGAVHSN